jgi:hypothetical protein
MKLTMALVLALTVFSHAAAWQAKPPRSNPSKNQSPYGREVIFCLVRTGDFNWKQNMQVCNVLLKDGLVSVGGDRGVEGIVARRDRLPQARRRMHELAKKYHWTVIYEDDKPRLPRRRRGKVAQSH